MKQSLSLLLALSLTVGLLAGVVIGLGNGVLGGEPQVLSGKR